MVFEVSVVMFDLDGTLFDHRGSVVRALDQWLPTFGVEAGPALTAAWFAAEAEHFSAWCTGEIEFSEQRRRRLRDFLPLLGQAVGTAEDLDRAFAAYLVAYQASWSGFDDARGAMTAVQAAGLRTAVLTNGATAQQSAKLSHLGLLDLSGPLLTAESLGTGKPSREAFLGACDHLSYSPDQVLYVGDDYRTDVLGARAAGLHAVHLARSDAHPEAEPHRITTLAHLTRLLA